VQVRAGTSGSTLGSNWVPNFGPSHIYLLPASLVVSLGKGSVAVHVAYDVIRRR
jgi:hypothetical protein